jgi:hypothetical protein
VHMGGSMELSEEAEAVFKRLERIGSTIMNRAAGGMFDDDPVGAILRNPDKKLAAAQILGQAYVTAYALMESNRNGLEQIAEALIEHKELHGDEVGHLLDSVDLHKPDLDLMNPATWPAV